VPRIRIGPALPDRKSLDAEVARLRDLGVSELRSRWHTVFGRQSPPHLPRHLDDPQLVRIRKRDAIIFSRSSNFYLKKLQPVVEGTLQ
jgi:hypothetical protein